LTFNQLFHGTRYENILSIVEQGYLEVKELDPEDYFPSLLTEKSVYGRDEGVWVTESRSCVEDFSWGGGYLVIDPSNLKVLSDRNRPYNVVTSDIGLENVLEIRLEENQLTGRDYILEIGTMLEDRGYSDIKLKEYRGPEYIVAD